MDTEIVPLSRLKLNARNPRTISDKKFGLLVDSILTFPKMLSIRPLVVTDGLAILGGNMRYRALIVISQMTGDEIEARLKKIKKYQNLTDGEQFDLLDYWEKFLTIPSAEVIMAEQLTQEELDEFVIKDNVGFGDWNLDELANEWNDTDLEAWGLDIPNFDIEEPKDKPPKESDPSHECPNCGHIW